MRYLIPIAFILLVSSQLHAQAVEERKSVIKSIRKVLAFGKKNVSAPPLDSLKPKHNVAISIDSLGHQEIIDRKLAKKDSLVQHLAKNRPTFPNDSLSAIQGKVIQNFNDNPLQKGADGVMSRKDSLQQKIEQPLQDVNEKISSVGAKGEELSNNVNEKIDNASSSVAEKSDQLKERISNAEGKAGELVSKVSDGEMNLQGGITDELNVPGVDNLNIPGTDNLTGIDAIHGDINLPSADGKLPGIGAGDLKVPEIGNGIDVPEVGTDIKLPEGGLDLNNITEKVSSQTPELGKVNDVMGEIDGLDGKLAQAEKYEGELAALGKGDLSSAENLTRELEERAADATGMGEIVGEAQKLTAKQAEMMRLVERYKDKRKLQQEILDKAKNIANDKLNKLSPAVQQAQEQIAKAQGLRKSFIAREFDFKKPNEMKDKPFYERWVPGITLNSYTNYEKMFALETGVQLGFKISGRFLVGAGGLYHSSFSEKNDHFVRAEKVYGLRAYTNIGLIRKFYGHAELELLHVGNHVNPFTKVESPTTAARVANFGLGRRYEISKKLNGSILFLYKLQFDGRIPSATKFSMRVGIDLNTKKRKKYTAKLNG